MDLEQIILKKIANYKNLLENLIGDAPSAILILDEFECGRAMATQNTIDELEEILRIVEQLQAVKECLLVKDINYMQC